MLVTRNWLKEYIGHTTPTTEEISELLMMHAFEIEGTRTVGGEEVIDVDILPNRASDSLSHRGIAYEIATLMDIKLAHDPLRAEIALPKTNNISINISDPHACRRFGAALMTGITIKESPDWMKARLEAIGQRSINNVVDATNYVMFSLGQPLHAYDAAKFPQKDGVWKFGVRFGKEGEKITVLTGEEIVSDESIQLIVDDSNDMPAGIAGVKGGRYAEIDEHTDTIILEAANFDPTITRKAAQKIKLQTDASKRFENEPSRDLVPYALQEVIKLIQDIGGGECVGYVDEYPTPYENSQVSISLNKINGLLGLSLTVDEVQKVFDRLGFAVETEDETFQVTAPFERTDITIAENLVEEIGRIYGYDHIVSEVPETVELFELNKRHFYSEKIRNLLISEGFSEVITSSFRKKDAVELRNYLASDKGYLRSSLQKNITEALERNIMNMELLNVDAVRIFEIGTVFYKSEDETDVSEHMSLTLGARTKKQNAVPKDNEILNDIQTKLEEELGVSLNTEVRVGILECNLTELVEALPDVTEYESVEIQDEIAYRPYSAFPYISRDIALWVPEDITPESVERNIKESAGELLIQTSLFDEFKKGGKVSYAFRLIFQSMEKTLTDDEVNSAMEGVSRALENEGYELR